MFGKLFNTLQQTINMEGPAAPGAAPSSSSGPSFTGASLPSLADFGLGSLTGNAPQQQRPRAPGPGPGPGQVRPGGPRPPMAQRPPGPPDVDLTGLSEEEKAMIQSVMMRAQESDASKVPQVTPQTMGAIRQPMQPAQQQQQIRPPVSQYTQQLPPSTQYSQQPQTSQYQQQPPSSMGQGPRPQPQPGVMQQGQPQPGMMQQRQPQPGMMQQRQVQPGVMQQRQAQPGMMQQRQPQPQQQYRPPVQTQPIQPAQQMPQQQGVGTQQVLPGQTSMQQPYTQQQPGITTSNSSSLGLQQPQPQGPPISQYSQAPPTSQYQYNAYAGEEMKPQSQAVSQPSQVTVSQNQYNTPVSGGIPPQAVSQPQVSMYQQQQLSTSLAMGYQPPISQQEQMMDRQNFIESLQRQAQPDSVIPSSTSSAEYSMPSQPVSAVISASSINSGQNVIASMHQGQTSQAMTSGYNNQMMTSSSLVSSSSLQSSSSFTESSVKPVYVTSAMGSSSLMQQQQQQPLPNNQFNSGNKMIDERLRMAEGQSPRSKMIHQQSWSEGTFESVLPSVDMSIYSQSNRRKSLDGMSPLLADMGKNRVIEPFEFKLPKMTMSPDESESSSQISGPEGRLELDGDVVESSSAAITVPGSYESSMPTVNMTITLEPDVIQSSPREFKSMSQPANVSSCPVTSSTISRCVNEPVLNVVIPHQLPQPIQKPPEPELKQPPEKIVGMMMAPSTTPLNPPSSQTIKTPFSGSLQTTQTISSDSHVQKISKHKDLAPVVQVDIPISQYSVRTRLTPVSNLHTLKEPEEILEPPVLSDPVSNLPEYEFKSQITHSNLTRRKSSFEQISPPKSAAYSRKSSGIDFSTASITSPDTEAILETLSKRETSNVAESIYLPDLTFKSLLESSPVTAAKTSQTVAHKPPPYEKVMTMNPFSVILKSLEHDSPPGGENVSVVTHSSQTTPSCDFVENQYPEIIGHRHIHEQGNEKQSVTTQTSHSPPSPTSSLPKTARSLSPGSRTCNDRKLIKTNAIMTATTATSPVSLQRDEINSNQPSSDASRGIAGRAGFDFMSVRKLAETERRASYGGSTGTIRHPQSFMMKAKESEDANIPLASPTDMTASRQSDRQYQVKPSVSQNSHQQQQYPTATTNSQVPQTSQFQQQQPSLSGQPEGHPQLRPTRQEQQSQPQTQHQQHQTGTHPSQQVLPGQPKSQEQSGVATSLISSQLQQPRPALIQPSQTAISQNQYNTMVSGGMGPQAISQPQMSMYQQQKPGTSMGYQQNMSQQQMMDRQNFIDSLQRQAQPNQVIPSSSSVGYSSAGPQIQGMSQISAPSSSSINTGQNVQTSMYQGQVSQPYTSGYNQMMPGSSHVSNLSFQPTSSFNTSMNQVHVKSSVVPSSMQQQQQPVPSSSYQVDNVIKMLDERLQLLEGQAPRSKPHQQGWPEGAFDTVLPSVDTNVYNQQGRRKQLENVSNDYGKHRVNEPFETIQSPHRESASPPPNVTPGNVRSPRSRYVNESQSPPESRRGKNSQITHRQQQSPSPVHKTSSQISNKNRKSHSQQYDEDVSHDDELLREEAKAISNTYSPSTQSRAMNVMVNSSSDMIHSPHRELTSVSQSNMSSCTFTSGATSRCVHEPFLNVVITNQLPPPIPQAQPPEPELKKTKNTQTVQTSPLPQPSLPPPASGSGMTRVHKPAYNQTKSRKKNRTLPTHPSEELIPPASIVKELLYEDRSKATPSSKLYSSSLQNFRSMSTPHRDFKTLQQASNISPNPMTRSTISRSGNEMFLNYLKPSELKSTQNPQALQLIPLQHTSSPPLMIVPQSSYTLSQSWKKNTRTLPDQPSEEPVTPASAVNKLLLKDRFKTTSASNLYSSSVPPLRAASSLDSATHPLLSSSLPAARSTTGLGGRVSPYTDVANMINTSLGRSTPPLVTTLRAGKNTSGSLLDQLRSSSSVGLQPLPPSRSTSPRLTPSGFYKDMKQQLKDELKSAVEERRRLLELNERELADLCPPSSDTDLKALFDLYSDVPDVILPSAAMLAARNHQMRTMNSSDFDSPLPTQDVPPGYYKSHEFDAMDPLSFDTEYRRPISSMAGTDSIRVAGLSSLGNDELFSDPYQFRNKYRRRSDGSLDLDNLSYALDAYGRPVLCDSDPNERRRKHRLKATAKMRNFMSFDDDQLTREEKAARIRAEIARRREQLINSDSQLLHPSSNVDPGHDHFLPPRISSSGYYDDDPTMMGRQSREMYYPEEDYVDDEENLMYDTRFLDPRVARLQNAAYLSRSLDTAFEEYDAYEQEMYEREKLMRLGLLSHGGRRTAGLEYDYEDFAPVGMDHYGMDPYGMDPAMPSIADRRVNRQYAIDRRAAQGRRLNNPGVHFGNDTRVPGKTYSRYPFPVKRILLTRDPKQPTETGSAFGMRVIGGKPIPNTSEMVGAFVAKIVPGGVVDTLGEVREGNQVMEWNGVPLTGKNHDEVQAIIRSSLNLDEVEVIIRADVNMPVEQLMNDPAMMQYEQQQQVNQMNQHQQQQQQQQHQSAHNIPQVMIDPGEGNLIMDQTGTSMIDHGGNPIYGAHADYSNENQDDLDQENEGKLKMLNYNEKRISGEIQLQICYDTNAAILYVTVLRAKNLRTVRDSSPDPFVKCYLLPPRILEHQRRTRYFSRTCDPEWKQTMVYPEIRRQDLAKKFLEISVWSFNIYEAHEFLGQVIIHLSENFMMDDDPVWYPLGGTDNVFRLNSELPHKRTPQSGILRSAYRAELLDWSQNQNSPASLGFPRSPNSNTPSAQGSGSTRKFKFNLSEKLLRAMDGGKVSGNSIFKPRPAVTRSNLIFAFGGDSGGKRSSEL